MNRLFFLILAAGYLPAITALAGESNAMWESRVVIAEDDGSGGEPLRIELSGSELGFDLQDMQLGESRSVVDKSGRSILITRTEQGYDFNVDGKTVSMPAFEHYAERVEIVDLSDGEFDVAVMTGEAPFTAAQPAGITIISPEPLDESTQASIRSVLQGAGHDDAVTFVDPTTMPAVHSTGAHAIKVIRKDVQISEQREP
ncbi:MAG TPA: hypothetical protein VLB07_08840 [Woeseiaceae bacterium]|nr:hypothetical protein [Woeseiaceae bacterium]